MLKKALKITIFCLFVLILFSSCSGKVKNCKFYEKNSESIRNYAKNLEGDKIYAQISCNF